MNPISGKKSSTTRREFVQDVTAGIALAGTLMHANLQAQDKAPAAANAASQPAQKAEPKYRKYFLHELRPEEREKGFGALDM